MQRQRGTPAPTSGRCRRRGPRAGCRSTAGRPVHGMSHRASPAATRPLSDRYRLDMQPTYPPEADAFRTRITEFLDANLPDGWAGIGALPEGDRADFQDQWRKTLRENNLLAPNWPAEYGGGGLTHIEQVILNEEFAKRGVPTAGANDGFSIGMVGNTILVWGTEEQKAHYIPRILDGVDVWCQGYSEPDAGSDLANVGCRAELDGDEWVINGQKIWTSQGHTANMIFCPGPHGTRESEARRHLVPARADGPAGRRAAADHQHGRPRPLQRGVLQRRTVPEGERARRPQQRLGRREHAARVRAGCGRDRHVVGVRCRAPPVRRARARARPGRTTRTSARTSPASTRTSRS